MFVNNTLATDDKYSFFNRDNSTKPIQIQLSNDKKKFLLIFFCVFQIYIKILNIFEKIDDPQSLCIAGIND